MGGPFAVRLTVVARTGREQQAQTEKNKTTLHEHPPWAFKDNSKIRSGGSLARIVRQVKMEMRPASGILESERM